ncbi:MAG: alpha/beta hydrolase, partial [Gillisia sp.]
VVYRYGNSSRKILLVHGWSGRGTQMAVLARHLKDHGWEIISFDAPAHGKAPGKKSGMHYFIDSIWHLNSLYGPFDAAIGHSLGGMSLLKTVKEGLPLKKLVIIGTANSITQITRNFVKNLQLNEAVAKKMKAYFDKKFGEDMDKSSGAVSAKNVAVPTLIVHDENDVDVDVSSAFEIHEALPHSKLLITKNLGHRKILGDPSVINKITTFITV